MIRDPDVVVRILGEIYDSPFNHMCGHRVKLALANGPLEKGSHTESGKNNQVDAEHIRWMLDDGYLQRVGSSYVRVTSKGSEFLENVRTEGVWQETKRAVAETGGVAAMDFIKKLAAAYAKKKIEQHTDLEL